MLGHMENVKYRRSFKPASKRNGQHGGVKGRPCGRWPLWMKVAATAYVARRAGSEEALIKHRDFGTKQGLHDAMESLFPGFWDYVREIKPRNRDVVAALKNRAFKMFYNGTSARGPDHDPNTRAAYSREHWANKVADGTELSNLYAHVRGSATPLPDWRERVADWEAAEKKR